MKFALSAIKSDAELIVNILGDFASRGFTLEYSDDHILVLIHDGEPVASFSQKGFALNRLREECVNHLAMEHDIFGI